MSGAQKISAIHTYIRTLGACRCCSGAFDLWSPATRRMNRHYGKIRKNRMGEAVLTLFKIIDKKVLAA
jgi:hypothetical protein